MKLSLSPNVLEKLKFGSVLEKLKFGSQLFRFVNFYSQLHTHLMAYYAKTGHSRPPLIAGLYRQLYQATPIVREVTSHHEKVKKLLDRKVPSFANQFQQLLH